MREIIDVFSGDAFRAVTLTSRINNVPFAPNLLGSMGLFSYDGIRTTDVAINELNGALTIIATSERGSAPEQMPKPKGTVRKAATVRLAREASVSADEVQNVLNNNVDAQLAEMQTPEQLINERMDGPFGLRAQVELTHEYHRIGAVKGVVLDKDGVTELFDWYDFFNIAPLADSSVNFGTLTADGGAFEVECTALKRAMVKELKGLPIAQARPVALCGDNYYDKTYSNKEAKAARNNRDTGRDGDVFTKNKAFDSHEFGGITFVNYRGTDDGTVGIHTDEARLVPFGVPGLFQMLFGPPDIMGMANTKGLPIYASMPRERQTSKQATVEAQSNPLTICLRPRALRKLVFTG